MFAAKAEVENKLRQIKPYLNTNELREDCDKNTKLIRQVEEDLK